MSTALMDMRAGMHTVLARVVQVFGAAHPHHAYLFANARANRMKVLVQDGSGVWLAARSLSQGRFVWGQASPDGRQLLSAEQLQALVLGLPWRRLGDAAVERQAQHMPTEERLRIHQQQSKSVVDKLKHWLADNRSKVPEDSATANAFDYSLRRWQALTVFVDKAQVPIDNNWVENQMRPIALGRKNWLFAGSHRAGQRAAAVMSLIQSAKLNGHDPHACHKDVMD